jgi:hypothetical protein
MNSLENVRDLGSSEDGEARLAGRLKARTVLWVPETLLGSRDLLILVEQSAEPVAPLDGVRLARRRLG